MFKKIMTVAALGCFSLTTSAAIVDWSPAYDTSSDADVETIGTLVEAINPSFSDYDGLDITVNGVTFTYNSTVLDLDAETSLLGEGYTSGDLNYDTFLSTFDYGNGTDPYSYTLADGLLNAGATYMVQLWFTDSRDHLAYDYMSYGDGQGNSVSLYNKGDNSLGEYAVGYFIADGDGQELVMQTGEFYSNIHLTAYQVREISVDQYGYAVDARVGVLGVMGLMMVGCGALKQRRRQG